MKLVEILPSGIAIRFIENNPIVIIGKIVNPENYKKIGVDVPGYLFNIFYSNGMKISMVYNTIEEANNDRKVLIALTSRTGY